MQAIKITLFIILGLITLTVLSSIVYLELFFIPAVLAQEFGQAATLIHLLSVLILIGTSAGVATWFRDRTIFKIQEVLVGPHLNKLMESIAHLTTGRWSADSYTHNEAFKTGAKLGFGMGYKVGESNETDRKLILEGISRMQLPAAEQAGGSSPLGVAGGQPVSLVNDMADYLDELDSRRRRLQED